MKSLAFHTELRTWIQSVIRQRKALIRMGKSKADAITMCEAIEYLEKQLNYYKFNDNRKISGFFQRNQSRILSLIPGPGATSHEIRMQQFLRYQKITKTLQDNENFYYRSFPTVRERSF